VKAANDTVPRRIGRVAIAVLLAVAAVGAFATWSLLYSADKVDQLSSSYGPAADANAAALTYMLDAETAIRGYALNGSPAALGPYRRAIHRVLPSIAAVRADVHSAGDRSLDPVIDAEQRAAATWLHRVGQPATRSVSTARRATETASARRLFDAFRRANASVAAHLGATRRSLRSDTETLSDWVVPIAIVAVGLVLLASGYFTLRTARSVSGPLTALSAVVRRLENGDLSARADETQGPVEVRAASAAVNSLASDRSLAIEQDRGHDRLRGEVRELTSAVRIGQDPQAVARTLVAGLGRVFAVDVVWLITFDDGRVPVLTEQWRPQEKGTRRPSPGDDELLLHALANRLWHTETVVGIPDHSLQADTDRIDPVAQIGDARASMIAAIGEGNSPIGLLWLASTSGPREWSTVERGLLQHVAAELAQSLVQNHVLSQQRSAMRRLREADEAKTALVSTVSHELRTPLTSIIGYLDLLLDTYGDELDPEIVGMLHVIERNATRLRSMIEDLLRQSEVEVGRRLTALDRVDLARVLDDVRETIAPLAANAELELDMRRPDFGAVIIDGDERELTQALINLAANAVKFTKPGGRVTVSAGQDREGAEVRVSDTGIGIPQDEIPHLFERFFRARNARSAVIPGTGLGLSIVGDIVSRHHGSIEVQSTLGMGTSFLIRLPLAAT
jgi:two-component system, OmpR family, phosphate regulon sensor histidine kinase PhoR